MSAAECPREHEVLEAIGARRWPFRASAELRDHVAGCEICRDVATVAAAFDDDVHAAWSDVRVPSSAHVWWRAQVRARQEAIAAASRPITVARSLAASCVAALLVAFATVWGSRMWQALPRWDAAQAWNLPGDAAAAPQWISSGLAALPFAVSRAATVFTELGERTGVDPALALAFAALLLAAPAAMYFALVYERV